MTPEDTSVIRRLPFSSDAALRRRFTIVDEPVHANLRVGLLLEMLDKLAEETALAYLSDCHVEARVVTAAMTDLKIQNAPSVQCDILMLARVNFVGTSSLEIGVRIVQDQDPQRHIASCYFTMVARKDSHSVGIPHLTFQTGSEKRRGEAAENRRALHRTERRFAPPNIEEYGVLHDLHRASEQSTSDLLLVRDLLISGWERTYPEFENVPQMIFGGFVIHRAYMYSHLCAELVTADRPLLISSDRIDFHEPVRMGDKLHFVSQVTYTGRASIAVETSIRRISRDRKSTAISNNCLFTFVNVDQMMQRREVPSVYPVSFTEDARFLAARRRHQAHLQSVRR